MATHFGEAPPDAKERTTLVRDMEEEETYGVARIVLEKHAGVCTMKTITTQED